MKLAGLLGFGPRQTSPPPRGAARSARRAIELCHGLLSERAEISGSRLANEALEAYQTLDQRGRLAFFESLAQEFSPNPEKVGHAGDAYRSDPSPGNLASLQRVVEPPCQELFRRLNMAPCGTQVLVEMRGEVLLEMEAHPGLKPLSGDLAHLFTSWFNRGFLIPRRIDWRTSAEILEKLIQYEAVHQIHGWQDLRRRLESDRRCYAFFHPALPDEPIIFIEVALAGDLCANVQALLDPDSPVLDIQSAEWAIFYSITNCQQGLRGVPFGSFLVKQVVEDLSREFPRIRKFGTVSPVPGFRRWLAGKAEGSHRSPGLTRYADALASIDQPGWVHDESRRAELEQLLAPLCAHYLLAAKQGKEPLDPVARFHLKNGARLERIHWLGDSSAAGLQRSVGFSANYVYRLAEVERNHQLYIQDHKVRASREIEALAKRFTPPPGF